MKWLLNIGKWLGNFGLFVLAFVLYIVLFIPLFILSTAICIVQALRKLEVDPLAKYYYENACAVDEGGNVHGGPFWNVIFFYPWAKPKLKFGDRNHTMSMVFGVNLQQPMKEILSIYTPVALAIIIIIEILDWGHMKRAAENYHKQKCSHGDKVD